MLCGEEPQNPTDFTLFNACLLPNFGDVHSIRLFLENIGYFERDCNIEASWFVELDNGRPMYVLCW